MAEEHQDELLAVAINTITEKASKILLDEFLKLPADMQLNLVLIKAAQLLLANVLCQVVQNEEELNRILEDQGPEIKFLTLDCAHSAFPEKFPSRKH